MGRLIKSFEENKTFWMFIMALILTLFGCFLLTFGFIVAPMGIIDQSVLMGVGEVFTFAGSILGIDATYRSSLDRHRREIERMKEE